MYATYSTLFERNAPLTVSWNAHTVNTAYSNADDLPLPFPLIMIAWDFCYARLAIVGLCGWQFYHLSNIRDSHDYVYYLNVICVILVLSSMPCTSRFQPHSTEITFGSSGKSNRLSVDSIFIVIAFVVYWISHGTAIWGKRIIRAIMRRNGTKRRTHYTLQSLRVPRSCTSSARWRFRNIHSQGCNCWRIELETFSTVEKAIRLIRVAQYRHFAITHKRGRKRVLFIFIVFIVSRLILLWLKYLN